jgi:hypothetical protein
MVVVSLGRSFHVVVGASRLKCLCYGVPQGEQFCFHSDQALDIDLFVSELLVHRKFETPHEAANVYMAVEYNFSGLCVSLTYGIARTRNIYNLNETVFCTLHLALNRNKR